MIHMSRKQAKIPESRKIVKNFTQGMPCPRCGCRHWNVWRKTPTGAVNMRTLLCRHCGTEVRSKEQIVEVIEETDDGSI